MVVVTTSEIVQHIKKLVEKRGSQTKVAHDMDVSIGAVSNVVRGTHGPTKKMVAKLGLKEVSVFVKREGD